MKRVHIVSICGVAMSALAKILKDRGYAVTGSDEDVHPPVTDLLTEYGIPYVEGHQAENLGDPLPDLVVVGNHAAVDNPEVTAAREAGLPILSLPQMLHELLADYEPIVVTGTHGKTSTCSLLAWMLERAGLDPSFMVGGIPRNLGVNTRLGSGKLFLLEGDEYLSAKFDRTPKFLYYRPRIGIVMNVALDHINFFSGQEEYIEAFKRFAALVPADGLLLAGIDSPNVASVAAAATSPVQTFGFAGDAEWQAANVRLEPERSVFDVLHRGQPYLRDVILAQPGRYVLLSALAAIALARHLGIAEQSVREALATFEGARRRLEMRGEVGGVTVVEDFAHHPTQARTSLETASVRFPDRRLWCVYDLHTFSSRNRRYLPDYAQAFGQAHGVVLPAMHHPEQIPEAQRMSIPELTEAIRQTQPNVAYIPNRPEIVTYLADRAQPGDVVLFMSSGGLEDLIEGLLETLRQRAG
ncbi:MAG TPA: hypothetical protein GX715_09195 [Armatimonadetes bacterium]|jgi:UDP-N-acetylmuramate: L-alanyl-gamma-D-glutamyl-meso-diaminopimelate ligase|nr:hypothetical protein [Armatimonadota bacterium]